MKVGIIGYGFVGQAVHSTFKDDVDVVIFDLFKKKYNGNQEKIFDCDINFVCVPTPAQNYGKELLETLNNFVDKKYKGLVVIKSTIMYDYIKEYEQKLNVCFNPEFLNQNTFIKDSLEQSVILLGGEIDVTNKVYNFYRDYTIVDADVEFCTLKEACDFKYIRNLYGAYKVLFWEFVHDTTGNSRKMAELFKRISYQSEMSQVGMDGFRGFGGACFPKDTAAWNFYHKHKLTKFMIDYNDDLNK